MDVATFIQAIQNMHGLTALMTEHLEGIASKLSDDQRAQAVADLGRIDTKIVDVLEAQAKHYEEGEKHIHDEMKVLAKHQEQHDRDNDASAAESALQNI